MSMLGKRKRTDSSTPYARPKLARNGAPGAALSTRGFAGNYGSSPSEKKVSDIDVASYDVNTSGSFTLLHIPATGADFTNRVGRKTIIKSVYIRGFVQSELGVTLAEIAIAGQLVRCIVFVDLQPNGAPPAVTDLLKTANPAAQLNLNNRDRFKILKDKQWTLDPATYSASTSVARASLANQTKSVKIYKRLNLETIFNGTNGGTIADINSGALYMFWISNVVSGQSDARFIGSTRVRFVDN